MNFSQSLEHIFAGNDLSDEQMTDVMRTVMTGEATPAQIGALLGALRTKGESVIEVSAAARVMRELATPVHLDGITAIDIVGTGGDASSTFNVSTCCSLVTAAAGVKVAKHGNRSVSSNSGAADLLEAAGVALNISAESVAKCIKEVGVGFMFAQNHHSAMRHAIGPRKEMATRTIFNLLGPMTNPAGVTRQILGVFDKAWVRPVAEAMQALNSEHVLVVHGNDGMDEISLSGPTTVAELKDGKVTDLTISPTDFGLSTSPLSAIQVDGAEQSLAMIHSVLNNELSPARDMVLLNSGAAIYVGGGAGSIGDGIEKAATALESGAASQVLTSLAKLTQEIKES